MSMTMLGPTQGETATYILHSSNQGGLCSISSDRNSAIGTVSSIGVNLPGPRTALKSALYPALDRLVPLYPA